MLKIILPEEIEKIKRQIKALERQLENDTREKDRKYHKEALEELKSAFEGRQKEELLFQKYLKLQSKEFKEDVLGYEHFEQEGYDLIIKVNFTWGWLRVYRTSNGQIEWY